MGNHIAETRSAAGMSKTTLCYTGVSKERENEKILINMFNQMKIEEPEKKGKGR